MEIAIPRPGEWGLDRRGEVEKTNDHKRRSHSMSVGECRHKSYKYRASKVGIKEFIVLILRQ